MREYSEMRGLSVWACCLISNHVLLVAVPEREASLSEGLLDMHTGYAMYFNSRTQTRRQVQKVKSFVAP